MKKGKEKSLSRGLFWVFIITFVCGFLSWYAITQDEALLENEFFLSGNI